MRDAVLLDDDSDDENGAVDIHTKGILHSLSQLTKLNIPDANEAIHRILACFNFEQNTETTPRERWSEKTVNKGNATEKGSVRGTKNKNRKWPCDWCHKDLCNKANLKRHILSVHAAESPKKRTFADRKYDKVDDIEFRSTKYIVLTPISEHDPSNSVKGTENKNRKWPCDWCHKDFSNKANLKRHILSVHAAKSPKTPIKRTFPDRNYDKVDDTEFRSKKHKTARRTARDTSSAETGECSACHKAIVGIFEHYRDEHNLELIRKDPGSDSKTKTKCKAKFPSTEHMSPSVGTENNGVIVYQCEACEAATSTYDASVEHAQLHLAGCRQITETCRSCKLMFEPQCFAEHSSNCTRDTERKILRYNPSNLLNDDWFNMFQGLPDTVANQIKSSSVYEHTRAIKINSAEVSGIPLYQCGVCELYVHPKEVEEHCNNKNTCVKNKSHDYYCPECKIYFYSLVAITEHCKEHKNGREINSFRKASFNCREDAIINKALKEILSASLHGQAVPRDENVPPVGIPLETPQRSRRSIDILENRPINKACAYCRKYILISELEAHEATHKRVTEDDSDLIMESEEEIRLDPHDKECDPKDDLQNRAAMTGCNDGTVEAWNSDSEPCSLNGTPYDVQVEVHVQKEEVDKVL